jgi:predicted transglutaminase-like cysteine proteinase
LTEVVLPSGEHHLILVVRTESGDFALDNLSANIRPVSQIRYSWVRAQSEKNPRFWTAVNFAKSDRVAMLVRKP